MRPDPESGLVPAETRLCVEAVAINPLDTNGGCWDLDLGCRGKLEKVAVDAAFAAAAHSPDPRVQLAALVGEHLMKKAQAPDPWAVVRKARGRGPAFISTDARKNATHAYWPSGEETCTTIDGAQLKRGIELTVLDEDLSQWVGPPGEDGYKDRRGQVVGRLRFYALPRDAVAAGQWWYVDGRNRFSVRLRIEARGEPSSWLALQRRSPAMSS